MKVDMSVVVGLVGMMSLTVLIKDGRLLLVSGGLEMKHKEAYLDRMLTMVTTAFTCKVSRLGVTRDFDLGCVRGKGIILCGVLIMSTIYSSCLKTGKYIW